MAMAHDEIMDRLQNRFPDAKIELKDLVGDADHYQLIIQDKAFDGKSKIQQHQMVYEALGADVGTRLHALTLKTIPLC